MSIDHTKKKTGTLALSSVSSSKVFMGYDIQPTIDYFNWLGSNPEIANLVNVDVVTKAETITIREIFSYIKQKSAKALFGCMATIDDVMCYSSWYYIACSDCKTKATIGPSLMCPKCGNVNVISVAQYLAKIFVYDNNDQAVFSLLGDAGRE